MFKEDFRTGAHVYCVDGECGKLHGVILDASTQHVVSLLVQRGFVLTTDCVLPLAVVDHVTEGEIFLSISRGTLSKYPGCPRCTVRQANPRAFTVPMPSVKWMRRQSRYHFM